MSRDALIGAVSAARITTGTTPHTGRADRANQPVNA
jgi:hypothetical protein